MTRFECKVETIWSIKKESFMQHFEKEPCDESLCSEIVDTTIPGYDYTFEIEKCKDLIKIGCFDRDNFNFRSVKRIKISIPSANYQEYLSDQNESEPTVSIKWADILNPEKKFFVDDILTMKFDGITKVDGWKEILKLNEILWYASNKDFTFLVGEWKIDVHKFVLREYSDIFDRMINSYVNKVVIKDFDYDSVSFCVDLCYENYYHKELNVLFEALRFAIVYEMPIIEEKIAQYLCRIINTKNVCEFANKSIQLQNRTLKRYCITYISKCIRDDIPYNGAKDLKDEIVQEIYKWSLCDHINS